jgi:hypothetical protein
MSVPSTITPAQAIHRAWGVVAATALVLASFVVVVAAPASATPPTTSPETGYDISFPQCGEAFPTGQSFAIVGVNDGEPNSLNPCFGTSSSYPSTADSELHSAVETSSGPPPNASLYVNTADPGDVYDGTLVTDWPTSGPAPYGYGDCTTTTVTTNSGPVTAGADSPACAWTYGADAANADLSWLGSAASSVGVSGAASSYPWWLDVETGNLWQQGSAGQAMNVAVLQGMDAALAAAGATSIGVFSTSYQWGIITGGTSSGTPAVGGLANWIPGANTVAGAEAACSDSSFTGGPVTLTQWTTNIDGDVLCGSVVTSPTPASPSNPCSGSTGNAAFLCSVYEDLLGRAPDPGGLAVWESELAAGVSDEQVAHDIATSPEYRSRLVQFYYEGFLRRAADPGGLASWVGLLNAGGNDQSVVEGIMGSPEFYADAGGTPSGFVTALYTDLLGRAADPGGLASWVGQLNAGVSLGAVVAGVLSSNEYETDWVEAEYVHLLDRAADPGGVAFWVSELAGGASYEQVIAGLVGSPEYYALSQET